jgi:uncharacterized protein (DUF983 family)
MLGELLEILRRGARLRCPCCGYGPLFESTFRMYERCSACDERFEREPGQWLGAIYINLALTMGAVGIGLLIAGTIWSPTLGERLAVGVSLAAVGPLVFFRYAKGLWTSIIFLGEGLYLSWPSR